ncbi:hypothetical protein G6F29_014372 [Rhizopus arrhizus]|nr:hypothetical protein G6F30_014383 [Rhizopus arrhizus]KAG0964590.1 hypothetical protein G6F29_014372 [Rhizopus arrhizus]KAG0985701.1 hypothetical protein G6F27_014314 [Rhizopus arrhizus]KAG1000843.1 hypothetical protein G6F26_014308 [Rhizopus arrhizus]
MSISSDEAGTGTTGPAASVLRPEKASALLEAAVAEELTETSLPEEATEDKEEAGDRLIVRNMREDPTE